VKTNWGIARRLLRARVIVLALMVAALSSAFLPATAGAVTATTPDPIVGAWTVTYGATSTVSMTLTSGVYAERALTPVRVTGGSCALPAGTVIATFSRTGPGAYSGRHGLWFTSNCSFDTWDNMTLTLSKDGKTLTAVLAGGYGTIAFTKVYHPQGADKIVGNWNVTYGATATVSMTLANGVYTEKAKTKVRVVDSSCDLAPGTVIATFSQTGPSTYAGEHGLWFTSNCAWDMWTGMTLSLSSDGNTLTAHVAEGNRSTFAFTRIPLKNVTRPAITGTVKVGSRVTATPGKWSPSSGVKFAYKWLANGTAIKGATAQTYLIPPALAGRKLSVTVTASKPGYKSAAASSESKLVAK
jgi:hypothetical protein